MKRILFSALFFALVFGCFAQSNCLVRNAYAFYTISVAGMAMADENGNTIPPVPIIKRFIYLEWTSAKPPTIEKVLYDKNTYIATVTAVQDNTVVPGLSEDNNIGHNITIKKFNSLWKIELQPEADDKKEKEGAASIIIKLRMADKICSYSITKETLLKTPPSY